jgi:hypothetical protein
MRGYSRRRMTLGGGRAAHFDSELSHAVTTTMPARMSVAVIMVYFPLFRVLEFRTGGGAGALLVMARERRGQAVEEPGHPEGSVGLLEQGFPGGAALAESGVTVVGRAMQRRP